MSMFLILLKYIYMFMMMMMLLLFMIPSNYMKIHPLIMGGLLFIYSVLISLELNFFNSSYLYSYMMFLIIVGGFLILFLYFNSFAINNKMFIELSMFNLFIYKVMMMLMIMLLMLYKFNYFNMILFINNNLMEMNLMNFVYYKMNDSSIISIYMVLNVMTIFMMIYLFYTLIIIVKMVYYTNPKSIRQWNF